MSPHIVLLLVAFVLFLLSAAGVPTGTRVQLGWLGLAFWVLDIIIAGGK